MYCPKCGSELENETVSYCPKCGKNLNGNFSDAESNNKDSSADRKIWKFVCIALGFISIFIGTFMANTAVQDAAQGNRMSPGADISWLERGGTEALVPFLIGGVLLIAGYCIKTHSEDKED